MAAPPSALIISFYIGAPECVPLRARARRAAPPRRAAAARGLGRGGTSGAAHLRRASPLHQRSNGWPHYPCPHNSAGTSMSAPSGRRWTMTSGRAWWRTRCWRRSWPPAPSWRARARARAAAALCAFRRCAPAPPPDRAPGPLGRGVCGCAAPTPSRRTARIKTPPPQAQAIAAACEDTSKLKNVEPYFMTSAPPRLTGGRRWRGRAALPAAAAPCG